jgi:hypothetical protein
MEYDLALHSRDCSRHRGDTARPVATSPREVGNQLTKGELSDVFPPYAQSEKTAQLQAVHVGWMDLLRLRMRNGQVWQQNHGEYRTDNTAQMTPTFPITLGLANPNVPNAATCHTQRPPQRPAARSRPAVAIGSGHAACARLRDARRRASPETPARRFATGNRRAAPSVRLATPATRVCARPAP